MTNERNERDDCQHAYIPMRTEELRQPDRTVTIISDIYCPKCGRALHISGQEQHA